MGKQKRVTEEEKLKIIAHYKHCNSMSKTAKAFGRSKSTVSLIIKDIKNEQFINEVEQIKREKAQNILDLIRKDDRVYQIANKILNIFNDEEVLLRELQKRGLSGLNQVYGTLTDKALKLKQIEDEMNVVNDDALQVDDGFDNAIKNSLNNINADDLIEPNSLEDKDV